MTSQRESKKEIHSLDLKESPFKFQIDKKSIISYHI